MASGLKKQVYLNIWHGIALKHIGNDVEGRNDYTFVSSDTNVLVNIKGIFITSELKRSRLVYWRL